MIDNPKTFDELRKAIAESRNFRYWEFDEIEEAEKKVDELVNTIQEQIRNCCNCFQEGYDE